MNYQDPHGLLTFDETQALLRCTTVPFSLGRYKSIYHILDSLKVSVTIEAGTPAHVCPDFLDEIEQHWREKLIHLESQIDWKNDFLNLYKDNKDKEILKVYEKTKQTIIQIFEEKHSIRNRPIWGCYDPEKNAISLFPENMAKACDGYYMDILLISTLAHETMHAYFNRPRHESFPYVYFVEETLAEFGMLLFLDANYDDKYISIIASASGRNICLENARQIFYTCNHNEYYKTYILEYLEAYKINLRPYEIPDIFHGYGEITFPKKVTPSSPITVKGQIVQPQWEKIFKCQPRYFYNPDTETLGLDGEWIQGPSFNWQNWGPNHSIDIDFHIHIIGYRKNVSKIYIGDNFYTDDKHYMMRLKDETCSEIIVSPNNKRFKSVKGYLFLKKENKPFLPECGDGLYEICSNTLRGVVDEHLNYIIPCVYDGIMHFDKNGLIQVISNGHLGLVNKQGEEQVPVIYDHINDNHDGTYTVRLNGEKFIINKNNNRI